ncbi:hypothetical protein J2TS6_03200 [Paenibacillus albilobatus]|uniref:Uncharacterized protein n=1 Tax=Paenibacillus albilobatus TaxID=2716884 RepID=A0A919XB27_9BACL|nr:hypothetical protein J2TS6_03200 [Paenibacillus albilobatus]
MLVMLKDGSSYIGTVKKHDRSGVVLNGIWADPRQTAAILENREKAQVSGLLSLLFGGGSRQPAPTVNSTRVGGTAANGGGMGMFGFFGKIIPGIQIGMNVMRSIMPLMGLLK